MEVVRLLGVTRQSVHNWVCRYRYDGRPAALDDAPNLDDTVVAIAQQRLPLVRGVLNRAGCVRLARQRFQLLPQPRLEAVE